MVNARQALVRTCAVYQPGTNCGYRADLCAPCHLLCALRLIYRRGLLIVPRHETATQAPPFSYLRKYKQPLLRSFMIIYLKIQMPSFNFSTDNNNKLLVGIFKTVEGNAKDNNKVMLSQYYFENFKKTLQTFSFMTTVLKITAAKNFRFSWIMLFCTILHHRKLQCSCYKKLKSKRSLNYFFSRSWPSG